MSKASQELFATLSLSRIGSALASGLLFDLNIRASLDFAYRGNAQRGSKGLQQLIADTHTITSKFVKQSQGTRLWNTEWDGLKRDCIAADFHTRTCPFFCK